MTMTRKSRHCRSLEEIKSLDKFRQHSVEQIQTRADSQWHPLNERERFRITPTLDTVPENIRKILPFHLEIDRK